MDAQVYHFIFLGLINIAHLHCRMHILTPQVPRVNTFEMSLYKNVHIRHNVRSVTLID
jgi:hypothetical protein